MYKRFVFLVLAAGIVLGLTPQAEATKQKIIVSALAFSTAQSTQTVQYAVEICGHADFHAPLNIPPGATINTVTFYVIDNSAANICMELDVSTPSVGALAEIYGPVCTHGRSNSVQTISLPDASSLTIGSESAASLVVSIGGYVPNFLCVYGARVTYTP